MNVVFHTRIVAFSQSPNINKTNIWSQHFVGIQNVSTREKSHLPPTKCFFHHYFRFVVCFLDIYLVKIQFTLSNHLFPSAFFNPRLFFLFSLRFTPRFARKCNISEGQNISTMVDCVFPRENSDCRPPI